MRKVLIVNSESVLPKDVYNPTSHWGSHLAALSIPYREVVVTDSLNHLNVNDCSHVILTGSTCSVAKEEVAPTWLQKAMDFVAGLVDHGLPVLGSCFGHQLLARIYGGDTAVNRAVNPELGWIEVSLVKDDDVLGQQGRSFYAFNLHFDEVVTLPNEWVILARSEKCGIQGFRHQSKPIWGIQSHVEMTEPIARKLMTNMLNRIAEEKRPLLSKAIDSKTRDSGVVQEILERFLAV